MLWFRLEAYDSKMRKVRKQMHNTVDYISAGAGKTFVGIPESEKKWLLDKSKDMGFSMAEVDGPPQYQTAECGEKVTDTRYHRLGCQKCMALRGKVRKIENRPSEVKSVFKVPGLTHFSVNGMLSVMKGRADEALRLASEYEQAIKALEGLESLEARMIQFRKEADEHRKALAYFLRQEGSKEEAVSHDPIQHI